MPSNGFLIGGESLHDFIVTYLMDTIIRVKFRWGLESGMRRGYMQILVYNVLYNK